MNQPDRNNPASPPWPAVAAALAEALGRRLSIEAIVPLGGGCISEAARLQTSAGPYFAKWHPTPPPGMFAVEAEGLAALLASGTTLVVPEPVVWRDGGDGEGGRHGGDWRDRGAGASGLPGNWRDRAAGGDRGPGAEGGPGFLVTTWLTPGRPGPAFDEQLGTGLAELHRATADAFGFGRDGYCGSTPQPNGWLAKWVDFYRERRLRHQVRLARDAGRMDGEERRLYDRLLDRLEDRLPEDGEAPALIHGDLWSGNLYVAGGGASGRAADGTPGLVDPAAYYAHREAELGMMTLFGGFGGRVFAAYEAAWPLAPGWRERNGLYQLYHLLNHLNLFGGGYGAQALAVARRYA